MALGIKDVSIQDIDMADRLSARKPSKQPNPINCKFTRRLAKVKVMAVRREVSNLQATQLGFESQVILNSLNILDHLTPRLQELLRESKKFKEANNFNCCRVRKGMIFLRKSEASEVIKLNKIEHLTALQKDE